MKKFVITAKFHSEIFALLRNTKDALENNIINWDVDNLEPIEGIEVDTTAAHVADMIREGKFDEVDDLIMGPEVPVGGMVVLFDGHSKSKFGFVCGHANTWFLVDLPKYVKDAFSCEND